MSIYGFGILSAYFHIRTKTRIVRIRRLPLNIVGGARVFPRSEIFFFSNFFRERDFFHFLHAAYRPEIGARIFFSPKITARIFFSKKSLAPPTILNGRRLIVYGK